MQFAVVRRFRGKSEDPNWEMVSRYLSAGEARQALMETLWDKSPSFYLHDDTFEPEKGKFIRKRDLETIIYKLADHRLAQVFFTRDSDKQEARIVVDDEQQ